MVHFPIIQVHPYSAGYKTHIVLLINGISLLLFLCLYFHVNKSLLYGYILYPYSKIQFIVDLPIKQM